MRTPFPATQPLEAQTSLQGSPGQRLPVRWLFGWMMFGVYSRWKA